MNKNYIVVVMTCALTILSALPNTKRISNRAQRKNARLQNNYNPLLTNMDIASTTLKETKTIVQEQKDIQAKKVLKTENIEKIKKNDINAAKKNDKIKNFNVVDTKNTVLSPFEVLQLNEEKEIASDDQKTSIEPSADRIELYFENADLSNFLKQIEDIFDVKFITDEIIDPIAKDSKAIKGNKISFKTHAPLTREHAWNLFVSIMQMAKFAVIPHQQKNIYNIVSIDRSRRSALPSFIGLKYEDIPETDDMIRYVYFVENTNLDTLRPIIESLKSPTSELVILKTHKAFMITDRAYNIKMLMRIIKELDAVSTPESMSILKLRTADAKEVSELYQSLLPESDRQNGGRLFAKKQPTSLYFPENTRIIAEPRTNALILLGPKNAIEKIEEFIIKHIDVELDQAYSPLYIYQLKYADAETVANIMNDITKFGEDTDAGKAGGVRGIDQYMRPMSFVAETETNRLIIKAHHDDYLKAKKVIEQLDEPQPQVAIEILILAINAEDQKSFGAQIRSKEPGPNGILGNNIKFQTSGLFGRSGIVENKDEFGDTKSGVERILGNLLNLVTSASPGNTILSLGKDSFGVWGIFQALKRVTNAEIVSNPFLLATNKTPAKVYLGEERRVKTATIKGSTDTTSFGDDKAVLEVNVTPQINSDGMIILELVIRIDNFVNEDRTDGTKLTKTIKTSTILSDREVLALGGFIQNRIITSMSKTPILGNIPLLGWFFKNKSKRLTKENLLILISPRIIASNDNKDIRQYTTKHINNYYGTIDEMHTVTNNKDPIHRMFFENESASDNMVESFIFDRQKETRKEKFARRGRTRRERRRKNYKNRNDEICDSNMNDKNTDAQPVVAQTITAQKKEKINPIKNNVNSKLHEAIAAKKSDQLLISDIFASARKGQNV